MARPYLGQASPWEAARRKLLQEAAAVQNTSRQCETDLDSATFKIENTAQHQKHPLFEMGCLEDAQKHKEALEQTVTSAKKIDAQIKIELLALGGDPSKPIHSQKIQDIREIFRKLQKYRATAAQHLVAVTNSCAFALGAVGICLFEEGNCQELVFDDQPPPSIAQPVTRSSKGYSSSRLQRTPIPGGPGFTLTKMFSKWDLDTLSGFVQNKLQYRCLTSRQNPLHRNYEHAYFHSPSFQSLVWSELQRCFTTGDLIRQIGGDTWIPHQISRCFKVLKCMSGVPPVPHAGGPWFIAEPKVQVPLPQAPHFSLARVLVHFPLNHH